MSIKPFRQLSIIDKTKQNEIMLEFEYINTFVKIMQNKLK
jgi:hypothetical protein